MKKIFSKENGDTLVEVTIALSILSMVLLSSVVTAAKASRMGQMARERTAISAEAQSQMELLRAYRDNNKWSVFLDGQGADPGVRNAATSGCKVTSPCIHMKDVSGIVLPTGGTMAGSVPTSYIEIAITPESGANPNYVEIVLSYGFSAPGGGADQVNHIQTKLVNLKAD